MSTPDWGNVELKHAVGHAVTFLRYFKPLGIEPRVVQPPTMPGGADVIWEIVTGDHAAAIGICQTLVRTPVEAIRLAVHVNFPAIARPPAQARAHAALQSQVADIACLLLSSLAGHHWSPE